MNLCATGHDEVCFEGRKCPFCQYMAEMDKAVEAYKDEINNLKESYSEQETVVEDLKAQLDDLLKPCLQAANGVTKQ